MFFVSRTVIFSVYLIVSKFRTAILCGTNHTVAGAGTIIQVEGPNS